MRFRAFVFTAFFCLGLTGCSGCSVFPVAKPWNSETVEASSQPCKPSEKGNKDHCTSKEENPDF